MANGHSSPINQEAVQVMVLHANTSPISRKRSRAGCHRTYLFSIANLLSLPFLLLLSASPQVSTAEAGLEPPPRPCLCSHKLLLPIPSCRGYHVHAAFCWPLPDQRERLPFSSVRTPDRLMTGLLLLCAITIHDPVGRGCHMSKRTYLEAPIPCNAH